MKNSELIREFWKSCLLKIPDLELLYPGLNAQSLFRVFEDYLARKDWGFHFFSYSSFEILVGVYGQDLIAFRADLKRGLPLSYIVGKCYFYDSEFYVDSNVLIPRFESEILVERSISFLKKRRPKKSQNLNVIEVGVGSGALLLSIAKEIDFSLNMTGTDISLEALKVAQKNLFHHQFSLYKDININWYHGDRLSGLKDQSFDLIYSNPPYIKKTEDLNLVHSMVKKYEPELALFLDDHIYNEWFDKFFKQVYDLLFIGGCFIMEGHENHLDELKEIANVYKFKKIDIIYDYTNRPRFLEIYK